MPTQLEYARTLTAAGISVLPIGENKRPASGSWKPFQTTIATDDELQSWFATEDKNGIGIVCGSVSGNLEAIDVDAPELVADAVLEHIQKHAGDIAAKLTVHRTPSGGLHLLYRVDGPIEGNRKLASFPTSDDMRGSLQNLPEIVQGDGEPRSEFVLRCFRMIFDAVNQKPEPGSIRHIIETRGEGGYVVGPHSPLKCGRPNARQGYEHIAGPKLEDAQTVTENERYHFHGLCRQHNCQPSTPKPSAPKPTPSETTSSTTRLSPGDDFNERADWSELLTSQGWEYVGSRGETQDWKRPGGTSERSATVNHDGSNRLFVFSSGCPNLDAERYYTKFGFLTETVHGGNASEAASELARNGYGRCPVPVIDIPEPDEFGAGSSDGDDGSSAAGDFFQFEPLTEFMAHREPPHYLCEDILAEGQGCIIGGPQKSLKTGLSLDLAYSLSSGTPFLGMFECERVRVGVMTGESNKPKIQRVIATRSALQELSFVPELFVTAKIPDLSQSDHLAHLAMSIERLRLQVVFIDPMYLCLGSLAESTSNVAAIGNMLRAIDEIMARTGCTPVLIHHTNRKHEQYKPLTLRDLSGAGFAEWARQWMLVCPRSDFDPVEHQHRLWMVAGGSAGHAGRFAVDLRERSELGDWCWEVEVRTDGEERNAHAAKKAEKQQNDEHMRALEFSQHLRQALQESEGSTLNELANTFRERGWSGIKKITRPTLDDFVESGFVKASIDSRGNNPKVAVYSASGVWAGQIPPPSVDCK